MLIAVTYSERQEDAAGHPNNESNLALVWVKSAHDLSKKAAPIWPASGTESVQLQRNLWVAAQTP
jgi:hypothetical protein